jgi:hypothetical protein
MQKGLQYNLPELKGFLFEGADEIPGIIIYASKITSRLKYVCKFIFNQGLLCNYILTGNENEFLSSKLARINYSVKDFENAINIYPQGLLENGALQKPELSAQQTGFDLFSAVFFFIGRVEEWGNTKKDQHDRAETEFTDEPLIDQWIIGLKKQLENKYSIQFPEKKFKYISTIDVDNVFAYKAKPFYRQIGGIIKDLKNFVPRSGTILFGAKDPFDEYELQVELSQKYNIPLIYFFLYRNNTKYDRTIDPNHPEFKKLLHYLNDKKITFGLHPSYDSSVDNSLLNKEIALLSHNSGKKIICSRQHFLRFNIRTTPKELIKAGIKYDFTMGFADWTGYKAGTSLPFFYYDIESESELDLLAIPFEAMDGAYYHNNKVTAFEAYNSIIKIAEQIKEVKGLFITCMHERSFSGSVAPGWKDLYIKLHENLKN